MLEPRRVTLNVSPLRHIDLVRFREDRATKAEKKKVADWLEERYGTSVRHHPYGSPRVSLTRFAECPFPPGREEWGADARELLDLVFGEETEHQAEREDEHRRGAGLEKGEEGEERERALRQALEKIANGFFWGNREEGCDGCDAANEMVEVAEAALSAASPGEPEGQPCLHCHGDRILMEADGSKAQPCPHCQPDLDGLSDAELTEPQLRALREIEGGRVRFDIAHGCYRSTVFPPAVRSYVVLRLVERGFAGIGALDPERAIALFVNLTDRGREVLADA